MDTTPTPAAAPKGPLQQNQQAPQPTKKRAHSTSQPSKTQTRNLTLTSPPWSYIHLQHHQTPQNTSSGLDALTAHLQITSALHQLLGLHGAAVPVDVIKLQSDEVWIRVPAADCKGVIAAVGGWVGRAGEGWRVLGWSSWSAGAEGKEGGRDLFGN